MIFNQKVEADFLFLYKHIVWQMLDRCFRFHAATEREGKDEDECIRAISETWVQIHGPPEEIVMDGESGVVRSKKCREHLQRQGIKLHPRGQGSFAWFIERRGALLRDVIRRIKSQLREEGLDDVPFKVILAEAVFCGNALLTINGSTPYNTVCGRVPRMLPSIDQIAPPGESTTAEPTLRHVHRLREISLGNATEGY